MRNKVFQNLVAQGLHALPLPYAKKAPPPAGWQKQPVMSLEQAEANDLLLDQQANNVAVGLSNGLVAVDVDIYNPGTVDLIFSSLQPSPACKVGAKGFTAFYRSDGSPHKTFELPEDTRKLINEPKAQIEFLAGNHYSIIAPSIHPETGTEYQWFGRDKELILANLPVFDRAAFEQLLDSLEISYSDWRKPKQQKSDVIPEAREQEAPVPAVANEVKRVYTQGVFGNDEHVKELIEVCLDNIPAECSNDKWIQTGYAINHAITGQEGFEIFKNWSSRSPQWADNLETNLARAQQLFFNTAPIEGAQKTVAYLVWAARQNNPSFKLTPALAQVYGVMQVRMDKDRYDIGNLDVVADGATSFTVPDSLADTPIWAEEVHVEFMRQLLGVHAVSVEGQVMIFTPESGRWQRVDKDNFGLLCNAYDRVALYIRNHPDVLATHVNAEGTFVQRKKDVFDASIHTVHRSNSVCKKFIITNSNLPQKRWSDFNTDPEVVLQANNTKICLRTGAVTPAKAEDYITRAVPVVAWESGNYGRIV